MVPADRAGRRRRQGRCPRRIERIPLSEPTTSVVTSTSAPPTRTCRLDGSPRSRSTPQRMGRAARLLRRGRRPPARLGPRDGRRRRPRGPVRTSSSGTSPSPFPTSPATTASPTTSGRASGRTCRCCSRCSPAGSPRGGPARAAPRVRPGPGRAAHPQTALQRSYRVGFAIMWEAWAERLRVRGHPRHPARRGGPRARRADRDLRLPGPRRLAGRGELRPGRRRPGPVAGLGPAGPGARDPPRGPDLAGPSDLITLDHDLGGHHVAVVLPSVAEGAAGQLVIGLRAGTGVRQSLVHPLDLTRTAIWLTAPAAWTTVMLRRLTDALTAAGVEASVSEPLCGLEGFRTAVEQAQDVERVRRAWGRAESPASWRTRTSPGDPAAPRPRPRRPVRPRRARPARRGHPGGRAAARDPGGVVPARQPRLGRRAPAAARAHRAQPAAPRRGAPRAPAVERRTELQVALRLQRLLSGGD